MKIKYKKSNQNSILGILLALIAIAIHIGIYVGIIWCIVHFISKYW